MFVWRVRGGQNNRNGCDLWVRAKRRGLGQHKWEWGWENLKASSSIWSWCWVSAMSNGSKYVQHISAVQHIPYKEEFRCALGRQMCKWAMHRGPSEGRRGQGLESQSLIHAPTFSSNMILSWRGSNKMQARDHSAIDVCDILMHFCNYRHTWRLSLRVLALLASEIS